MPSLASYSNCCGASILQGFNDDPNGVGSNVAYPALYGPVDGYESVVFREKPKRGYYGVESGKLLADWYGYSVDENGKRITKTARESLAEVINSKQRQYPGHLYSCVLTARQIKAYPAWLELLKEFGFECVRRWTNSVHNDQEFLYFFILCTDGKGKCRGDNSSPPPGWNELPEPNGVAFGKAA
jgi:hypothetical protein